MAESTLSLKYLDIQVEVGRFLGFNVDPATWTPAQVAEVDRMIQAGYRQFLYPPAVEGVETGYEWSFLNPETTITTYTPYDTGTVTVVTTTCTLTGGVWPAWLATNPEHATLTIDDTEYTVTSRDSDVQLTVSASGDVTDETFELVSNGKQDLPDAFGRILGDFHYKPTDSNIPIVHVSEHQMNIYHQQSTNTGKPRYFTTKFKTSDGSDGQRQEVKWWPIPDDDYELTYRYEAYTGKLVKTTYPYPLGGMRYSEVIIESCMAIAEQRMNGKKDLHWDSFARLLATAVEQDRKNSAGYYGPMSKGEKSAQNLARQHYSGTNYPITYDGSTW